MIDKTMKPLFCSAFTLFAMGLAACGDDTSTTGAGGAGGEGSGGAGPTSSASQAGASVSSASGAVTSSAANSVSSGAVVSSSTGEGAGGAGGNGQGGNGQGGNGQGGDASCDVDVEVYVDADVNDCGNQFCCEDMTACANDPASCFDEEGNLLRDGEALDSCMIANGCFPPGICTTGIIFNGTDQETIDYAACLSESCCDVFLECTGDGADVQGCLDCFNGDQVNFDLCIEANTCAEDNCEQGLISIGVCDSGIAFQDPELSLCAGEFCCEEFNTCTDDADDVDACIECFNDGGGPLCDDAGACIDANCSQPGVCDSGIAFQDPELSLCAGEFCCEEFNTCTDDAGDIQACIDCFDAGGGPLCDDAGACIDTNCTQPGVCDSGITFDDDPELNACAGEFCCEEFNACTDDGGDVDACIECFVDGGGALCDAANACVEASCGGEGGGGTGGSGTGGDGTGGA